MRRTLASALALCLLLPEAGRAGARPAVSSFDFLALDANARAAALGGAYTALAADANALQYNPAGLGRMKSHEVTLMHDSYLGGVNHEYLGLATRQGLGIGVNYLSFGSISRTSISSPNETNGDFNLSDLSAAIGYGHSLGRELSAGAAYKYVRETVDDVRASGHAIDAGLMWAPSFAEGLTIGGAARNMGGPVRFQSARERLPFSLRGGAAYEFKVDGRRALISADAIGQRDADPLFAAGAELVLAETVALRMGWSSRNQADIGLTAGAGVQVRDLSVDYAVVPFGDFELAHRISVTWRWGREDKKVREASKGPRPTDPELLLERAEEHLRRGEFAEARELIETAIAMVPPGDHKLTKLHERLGWTWWCLGNYSRAKAAYSESLRLAAELGMSEPGVTEAYLGMGMVLKQRGDASTAAIYLKTALERDPKGPSGRKARELLLMLKQIKPEDYPVEKSEDRP